MLKDIVDTSKHLLAVEQMSTGTGKFLHHGALPSVTVPSSPDPVSPTTPGAEQ